MTLVQPSEPLPPDRKPLRALFLADVGPIPARAIWAWRESGHEIAEVWTGRAQRGGTWKRDRRLGWVSPRWSVSAAFRRFGIRHRHIQDLKAVSDIATLVATLEVDVVISVHFMRILPAELLARLPMPVLNLHPALLPAYRGPAPLISMILDQEQGLRCSGVTLHKIVPAIDAGPIFASRSVPFPADRSFRRWELDLARASADLAVNSIPDIVAGRAVAVEQDQHMAFYRRATAENSTLTPGHTTQWVAWICSTIGRMRPVKIRIDGRELAVTGISRHLGAPSGRPADVRFWTIETDLADARVRLRRRPIWEGRRRRTETWLLRALSRS